jgi:lipoprotein-releasing system permease protein
MISTYEFFIAFRYLKSKRKNAFISLITFISIAGITVGVMALIIVLAVMSGFEEDLKAKILGTNSHVVVLSIAKEGMENYSQVVEKVKQHRRVVSATPFIFSQVMLTTENNVAGVVLRGILPEEEGKVTEITKNIIEGDLHNLSPKTAGPEDADVHGIVIGRELAGLLGAYMGDPVNVVSPLGRITPLGMVPKMTQFRVVGIFDSGLYEYDTGLAYISLKEAQRFFDLGERVTGIEVKINDIYAARSVKEDIQDILGAGYWTKDWMQMNRNLFSALKLEKVTMFIILSLIILVAALNIISSLTMLVMEKGKEIAILKSMGARRKSIMQIFMVEGMIIGFLGTTFGCLLGLLVALNLETVVGFIENLFHFKIIDSSVYYIDNLPSRVKSMDVTLVVIISFFISLFSTIFPSYKASKLDPVETIRYE